MTNDRERPFLSVLMPVYNESRTAGIAIDRLEACDFGIPMELVVVDDGSTDGSTQILRQRSEGSTWIRLIEHDRNRGKGAAVKTALERAEGRFCCFYDADLEYDPQDIEVLLVPVLTGKAEIVFGARAFGGHSAHSYLYVLGNRLITTFCNVLFNCYLRDITCCLKLLPTDTLRSIRLTSQRFSIDAEVTGRLLAAGHRIYEVPITYHARTHAQGKKLKTSDGWNILLKLLQARLGFPGRNGRLRSRRPTSAGRPGERRAGSRPEG